MLDCGVFRVEGSGVMVGGLDKRTGSSCQEVRSDGISAGCLAGASGGQQTLRQHIVTLQSKQSLESTHLYRNFAF